MGDDKDRLSILEKIERGEISFEDAEVILRQTSEKIGVGSVQGKKQERKVEQAKVEQTIEKVMTAFTSAKASDEASAEADAIVPTRRERKLALAERFQSWQPQMMVGLEDRDGSWQWPWADKSWQWMWQNFDYPIYIGHSIDVAEGSELQVVVYQGDLFIRGWDEPMLKINGAIFDIRIGQDEKVTRIASSTGQLQIWVPDHIARVEASVNPGDIWLSNISADIDLHCQSGDLGCEQIKGDVKARINGGDARLMGINGSIDVNVIRGNGEVRDINSPNVTLKATGGNIWLSLDSVNSGHFLCENKDGDINLLISGDLACELLVEATEGGRISPVSLPWQKLLERSEGKLHGILKGGGASINLISRGGKIYIQESWIKTFPTVSPS